MTDAPRPRGPGRPRKERDVAPVLVRFDARDLAAIDQACGETSRTDWIVAACVAAAHQPPLRRLDPAASA